MYTFSKIFSFLFAIAYTIILALNLTGLILDSWTEIDSNARGPGLSFEHSFLENFKKE